MQTIVIAVGGNSLIEDPTHISIAAQYAAARKSAASIVRLVAEGYRVLLAHGNGPQVGFILRRSEFSRKILHTVPLDSCVADTQGAIGYNLQMALRNEAVRIGIELETATVVTLVEVDPADPSFTNPTKPIGSFMTKEDAEYHRETDGWDIAEDAGRGYRRVVPSPKPIRIIEEKSIRALIDAGTLVIAAGGGGIPVARESSGELVGIEAVIDKDYASSLLARDIEADMFIISTAVEKVCLNYGSTDQLSLDRLTCTEAEHYIAQGHFAPGSMLPKIIAVLDYVRQSGNPGIITSPDHLLEAVSGEGGTRIVPD